MKKIRYKVRGHTLVFNQETGTVEEKECFAGYVRDYSEANEETARREAYHGEYTIEDDGQEEAPERTAQEDTDAMLIDHEYRLTLLELGLTE